MRKALPKELTSYDLLKALAVILMVCDHVGHHFYPDEMWFRIIGRLCVPIWFFLIGYARTVEVTPRLWIGAGIIAVSAIIAGQFLLPLNILFTIIILRLLRQKGVERCLNNPEGLRGMFFILVLMAFPTGIVMEYGTSALLFSLIGYMVRNREEVLKTLEPKHILFFTIASFAAFYFMQGISLPTVSSQQALFLFIGLIIVGWTLWRFQPAQYIDAPNYMAPSLIRMIQFMGRRTLEIYVAHIVLFRAICMYLYPDRYGFLEWNYVPLSMVSSII